MVTSPGPRPTAADRRVSTFVLPFALVALVAGCRGSRITRAELAPPASVDVAPRPALGPEPLGPLTDEAAPGGSVGHHGARAGERPPKILLDLPGRNYDWRMRADGKQILFSHADEDSVAEIYTVDLPDGSVRQVTRLERRAAAPAYHPGGDYITFVTREAADGPASAWVIDRLGRADAVRVAQDLAGHVTPEFDAVGDALLFHITRADGTRVVKRGTWSDQRARRLLGQRPTPPRASSSARAWVEYLADPYFEGRPTGGPREPEYLATIARAFEHLGLKPFGASYEMPFPFVTEVELSPKNFLELQIGETTSSLALSGDYIPSSYSAEGAFTPAPIVFAGYGLSIARDGPEPAYDSFGDLDVRDKWVTIFEGLPARVTTQRRFVLHERGRLLERILNAQNRGAAGVFVLDDPATPAAPPRLRTEGRPGGIKVPVLRLSRRQGERLFAAAGSSLKSWARRLADGETPTTMFARTSAAATVGFVPKTGTSRNIVGILSSPGATSSVLIGAHVDGHGRGERGGSLDSKPDVVLPGANDNASGVAALLQTATKLKERAARLKQNIIFAVWSGTELGAIGSQSFVGARGRVRQLSAALNLNAVGEVAPAVGVRGTLSAAQWTALLDPFVPPPLVTEAVPPDDAGRFADERVPALTITTGAFAGDRTAADRPDRVNFESIDKVVSFTVELAARLAREPGPQVFIRLRDRAE